MKLQPLCRTTSSHEGMTRMKNKIIKLLAWICIGLSFGVITACDNTEGSKPILKIITSTAVGFYFSNTHYYVVYDNGAVKKTEKFDPADVINYYFLNNDYGAVAKNRYNLDINTPEGEEIREIANNILLLIDETKLKDVSVSILYILNDQYFFIASCYNGKKAVIKCLNILLLITLLKKLQASTPEQLTMSSYINHNKIL